MRQNSVVSLPLGVTNRHLKAILAHCHHCTDYYANRDYLPPLNKWVDQFCLMNTDFRNGQGKHFVLLYQPSKGQSLFYYDPLGPSSLPFQNCLKQFLPLLQRRGLTLKVFPQSVAHQPKTSFCCGYFCIAFIHLKMHRGWSMRQINRLYQRQSSTHPDFIAATVVTDFLKPRSCKKKNTGHVTKKI